MLNMGQFDIVKQFNYLLFELLRILENVASYIVFILFLFFYFLSLTEWTWNIEDQDYNNAHCTCLFIR